MGTAMQVVSATLPDPIVRLIAREARSVTSVGRWVLRRSVGVRAPAAPHVVRPISVISYGREQIGFGWIFMGLTVLEITVVEVIVPWTVPRWILLALGVYGLLVMAGFVAANRTRPHILTDDWLYLRRGLQAEVTVPIDQIATVSVGLRSAGYGPVIEGETLVLGIAGSTNAAVNLGLPVPIRAERSPGTSAPSGSRLTTHRLRPN